MCGSLVFSNKVMFLVGAVPFYHSLGKPPVLLVRALKLATYKIFTKPYKALMYNSYTLTSGVTGNLNPRFLFAV